MKPHPQTVASRPSSPFPNTQASTSPPSTPRATGGVRPRLRPKRGPRPEEIALMRRLIGGPVAVSEGPIGRCCRRGWCKAIAAPTTRDDRHHGSTTFELTELGRTIVLASSLDHVHHSVASNGGGHVSQTR